MKSNQISDDCIASLDEKNRMYAVNPGLLGLGGGVVSVGPRPGGAQEMNHQRPTGREGTA